MFFRTKQETFSKTLIEKYQDNEITWPIYINQVLEPLAQKIEATKYPEKVKRYLFAYLGMRTTIDLYNSQKLDPYNNGLTQQYQNNPSVYPTAQQPHFWACIFSPSSYEGWSSLNDAWKPPISSKLFGEASVCSRIVSVIYEVNEAAKEGVLNYPDILLFEKGGELGRILRNQGIRPFIKAIRKDLLNESPPTDSTRPQNANRSFPANFADVPKTKTPPRLNSTVQKEKNKTKSFKNPPQSQDLRPLEKSGYHKRPPRLERRM